MDNATLRGRERESHQNGHSSGQRKVVSARTIKRYHHQCWSMGVGRDTLRQIQTFRSKSNGRDCGVTVIGTVTHRARGWKLPDMKEDRQYKQWLSKVILQDNIAIFTVPYKRCGLTKTCSSDDDAFYVFLQKQKIGAELHVYLEEGTYHKRLFRGLTLMI